MYTGVATGPLWYCRQIIHGKYSYLVLSDSDKSVLTARICDTVALGEIQTPEAPLGLAWREGGERST